MGSQPPGGMEAGLNSRASGMRVVKIETILLIGLTISCFFASPSASSAREVRIMAAGGGTVRAFIIGINEYANEPTLRGAVADARDIEGTLKYAGVSDLSVLIGKDASRSRVETGFRDLVSKSKAGDLAIIAFAGHGAQQPERVKGSEADGMDEVFLLPNFSRSGRNTKERIIDDEINHWLVELDKKQVDVIFVADTCHGGGLTRGVDSRVDPPIYRTAGVISADDDDLKPLSSNADAFVKAGDFKFVTFLGAVDKYSKAPEMPIPGNATSRGALSYSFARLIDSSDNGDVTRERLFSFTRQVVYQYSNTRQAISTEPSSTKDNLAHVVFRLRVTGEREFDELKPTIRLRIINGSETHAPPAISGQTPFRVVRHQEQADLIWDVAAKDVLNAGDVIAQCSDPTCIASIIDRTSAVYSIARLSEARAQTFRLIPDDARHRLGEIVTFHLDGVGRKFLILFNIAADGTVQFLYPRTPGIAPLEQDEFDLSLKVSEPLGGDQIVAIVSDARLFKVEELIRNLHNQKMARIVPYYLRNLEPSAKIGMVGSFTGR